MTDVPHAHSSERPPLHDRLAVRAVPAELAVRDRGTLRCTACAHRCGFEREGRVGACGVRFLRDGELQAPFGYVARRHVRAVETNTVYHVAPGGKALIFGMYGCDLRCGYCHNWKISQALREDTGGEPVDVTAEALVDEATAAGCRVVAAAYNEPMIAAEWVRAVFTAARARDLRTVIVSDGNTTPEALAYVAPVTDVYRIDLKGFTAGQYRALGGRPAPVMDAIVEARRLGMWVEIVTLVVPSFNDDVVGLRELARQLVAIDPDLPWHLNAFQPRYKMRDRPPMGAQLLVSAAGAAYALGLRYVYVGNLSSVFSELEHTRCPECHAVVVERHNYATKAVRVEAGRCPDCGTGIPGLW